MAKKDKLIELLLTIAIAVSLIVSITALSLPTVMNLLNEHMIEQIENESLKMQKNQHAIEEQMQKRQEAARKKALLDPYSKESLHELNYDPITVEIYAKHLLGKLFLPSIKQALPIFDNASEQFLQRGSAWLASSGELTGGISNHSVVAGHSGLPRAKLFNDLLELKKGDLILYQIAEKYYAYRIFEIKKVTPENTTAVRRDHQKDLTTLVTCVPIGINTHRLLVTGERIAFTPSMMKAIKAIKQEKNKQNQLLLYGFGLLILIIILIIIRKCLKIMKAQTRGTN